MHNTYLYIILFFAYYLSLHNTFLCIIRFPLISYDEAIEFLKNGFKNTIYPEFTDPVGPTGSESNTEHSNEDENEVKEDVPIVLIPGSENILKVGEGQKNVADGRVQMM